MSTAPPRDEAAAPGGDGERPPERLPAPPEPRTSFGSRMGAAGMPVERSRDFRSAARRLAARLAPERALVLTVLSMAVVSVSFSVFGPRLLGDATNTIVEGVLFGRGVDQDRLRRLLLTAGGLYLTSSTMSWLQARVLAGVVQRSMQRLRADVEVKVHRLPLRYLDRTPRGDLLSRVTNDIDNVAQSLQQSLSQMLTSTLTIVGTVVMMFVLAPVLALVAVVTIPTSILTMRAIARRSRPKFIAQWTHTGSLNAQVEEAFTGHTLVKVFGRQRAVEERFAACNDDLFAAGFAAQFYTGTIQPAMTFVGNLNFVAIAVLGGLRVSSGAMTIGEIQAFIQYSRQFAQPLTQVASMVNVLQSGIASAERVFELLDVPEEPPDAAPAGTGPHVGRVEFERVGFAYDPAQPLIEDLSLLAAPGRTVAIVGPTGAGKTTLVNLLMRFYDVEEGRITLDGVDTRQMTRHELRSAMGMVLQDTWLFEGTIRENIAYGDPTASEERVLAAARAAYVDRFVHALPHGYDTVVDDEGTSISAGEKQLITIARAFLADPTILILDEATSSVDTRTEVLIQHAMAALRTNRTSFVIAHRLSTIRDADVILVMEQGAIVEQGSHHELLASGGPYARLYQAQFAAAAVDLDT